MSYFTILCIAVLLCVCGNASAIGRDTTYADSVLYGEEIGAYKVSNPKNVFDTANGTYASFGLGSFLDVAFTTDNGKKIRTIRKGANPVIWVYGRKDPGVDTSAGQLVFFKMDASGASQYQSRPFILEDGLNEIIVPDSDFTYLEFTLTGTEFSPGSKGYLIDAIMLIQDSLSAGSVANPLFASASLSNYPNPFIAGSETTITLHLEASADAEVRIYDVAGREVAQYSFGTVAPGEHKLPVTLEKPQAYIARLFLDGVPAMTPLRLAAQ